MNFFEIIYRFLSFTAWKMETPKPYGLIHLSFFASGVIISVFLAIRLKNCDEKQFNKVLTICSVTLFIMELYKQLFFAFYLNDGIYQWNICPFNLCDMPLYLGIAAANMKNNRKRNAVLTFMATYNFLGGFASFFEPSGLLHDYWTLTFHALIWHMILVFLGMFIALNRNSKISLFSFLDSIRVYGMLALIAYIININVMYFTDQSTNMFFVGPENSPLIVFSTISEKYGWFTNTIIYSCVLSFGAFIIYAVFRYVRKKIHVDL